MIELVFEIRRRVPSELKPGVKLANPELFDELIAHYNDKDAKTITKALIKELLTLGGKKWALALETYEAKQQHNGHQTKMYRGLVSLEEKEAAANAKPKPNSKKKIYRGQVIA